MTLPLRSAASVFSREAYRTARRWQTWALRGAFASVLFAIVLVAWSTAISPVQDKAQAAQIGHNLFLGYVATQMTLVGILAPVLVGQGIVEERDGQTLPLLALTRLTPGQILWGKVGSRLALLGTLVLGGTPLLAVSTTFGGVGPWQVVNAVVNTLLLLVVLGALGGLFGLLFEGTLAIVAAAALWTLAAFVIVPLSYAAIVESLGPAPPLAHLSPLFGAASDDAAGLLPTLAALPLLLTVARWASPLFAVAATDPDEAHGHVRSPEARLVETRSRGAGRWGLAAVIVAPIGLCGLAVFEEIGPFAWRDVVSHVTVWLLAVLVVTSGTALFVLLLLRATEVRRVLLAGLVRARTTTVEGAVRRRPLAFLRNRVVGHPVVWREVFTNAYGFSSLLARWSFPLWFLGTVWFGVGRFSVAETVAVLVFTGVGFGGVVTLAIGGETITEERRRHTLELLATTTLPGASIVLGKLAAIALLAGPYLVAGVGSYLLWWVVESPDGFLYYGFDGTPTAREELCGDWWIGWGVLPGRAALTASWAASVWLVGVLGSMLGALWVRPPRLAWVVTVGVIGSILLLPVLASEALPDPVGGWVSRLLMPFETPWSYAQCGTSPWLVASAIVYALTACSLFLACTASIRLVVQRDAR